MFFMWVRLLEEQLLHHHQLVIVIPSGMFHSPLPHTTATQSPGETPVVYESGERTSEENADYIPEPPRENMAERIQQLKAEAAKTENLL